MPRKSPGGPRDAFLTARVPERTKFGLQLMTRIYREPAPDLLIRALNRLFDDEHAGLFVDVPGSPAQRNLLDWLWAERESDRAANMAFRYPPVMTGAEKRAWKEVLEDDSFWAPPAAATKGKKDARSSKRQEKDLNRDVLAAHWSALLEKASMSL